LRIRIVVSNGGQSAAREVLLLGARDASCSCGPESRDGAGRVGSGVSQRGQSWAVACVAGA
jgi:hypothetical protein